ncbi:hypothetical protein NC653_009247 [Populus alba x Populus x berolinensis]|uniref:Uncharacterized protein n=1 Tax=Populus alba x Populus x berolinensis TaxID=444605 RepID=A0AAD6W9F8_9ROSI|nr:hypothetical protein NC653_009247 [Populus alba x Populus x berolinensis]
MAPCSYRIFGCFLLGWLGLLSISGHFAVTYHFFHWKKGTPFADDQGIYNGLTWWEQIENGKQLTRNRKFLTVVPVIDSLAHNRLSKSNALLQHIGCICAGCCQVPKHAQGSHIRNQC